jgi:hypothetical protein
MIDRDSERGLQECMICYEKVSLRHLPSIIGVSENRRNEGNII